MSVERVTATPAALEVITRLRQKHGPLMFYQSSGCCDNSAPNCYLPGELNPGPADIHLGDIAGAPFYMNRSQYEYWQHTQLIIDVMDAPIGSDNFSLEGPEGKAFLARSRLFSDDEWTQIKLAGELARP